MRIFGLYEGERVPLEIPEGANIAEIKAEIRRILYIPEDTANQDKKTLTLFYAGSKLDDVWVFADLGIRPGVSILIKMVEEDSSTIQIYCVFNQTKINLQNGLQIRDMMVSDVKVYVSQTIGIPVGIFRLMTNNGLEMYDCKSLDDYDLEVGDVIRMESWDGWNDFLRLAIMGFTPHVLTQLSSDDVIVRYQMKTALFIAAFYGHVDLAVCLLRHGLRSDEPTGEHPLRQWCEGNSHPESKNTPVHIAAANGQLNVLRSFVNQDISVVLAKDGNALTPLNIALRKKQKQCATFLLTKQWSRVPVPKNQSLTLTLYCKVRKWCDLAKQRVYLLQGHAKSSLKKRAFGTGALVSNGVMVDGFSQSKMNGRAKAPMTREEQIKLFQFQKTIGEDEPEVYFKNLAAAHIYDRTKITKTTRWGKVTEGAKITVGLANLAKLDYEPPDPKDTSATPTTVSKDSSKPGSDNLKLPPLMKAKLMPQISQRGHGKGEKSDVDGQGVTLLENNMKRAYITTGSAKLRKSPLTQSVPDLTVESDIDEPRSSNNYQNHKKYSMVSSIPESRFEEIDSVSVNARQSARRRRKKARNLNSAFILSSSETTDGSLPLPVINLTDMARPQFYYTGKGNIAKSTLALYEHYRGMKARDYAIKCLTITNSFKDKPWLERVRMAVTLNAKAVKKLSWETKKKNRLARVTS